MEILEWYDEVVYQNTERGITMKMPAVARLLKPVSAFKKGVKFSRVNVMARDNFVCQYCGDEERDERRSTTTTSCLACRAAKPIWENIVTACYPCNDKKGARTPEQAKMKLIRKPFRPKTFPLAQPVLAMRNIPPEWEPYVATSMTS